MATPQKKKSSLNELPKELLLGNLLLVITPSSLSIQDTPASAKGVSVETPASAPEKKNNESSVRSFCFVGEVQPDKNVFWYYSPLEGYEKKKLRVEESVVAAAAAHNAYKVDPVTGAATSSTLENSNLSLASVTHITQIFLRLGHSSTFREYYVAEEQNAKNKRDPSTFSPPQFAEQGRGDAAPAEKERRPPPLNKLILPLPREEDVPAPRTSTTSNMGFVYTPTRPVVSQASGPEQSLQPQQPSQSGGSFSRKSPVLRAPCHVRRLVAGSKDTLTTPSNSSSTAFLSMSTGTYYARVNVSEEGQGQTNSTETATALPEGGLLFRPAPPRVPSSLSNSGSRPLSRIPSHRRPNIPLVPHEAIENK